MRSSYSCCIVSNEQKGYIVNVVFWSSLEFSCYFKKLEDLRFGSVFDL